MFAVMKHWDIMIGVDMHECWPPGSPYPVGPKPYLVCMLMTGTMLTAQMAFTAVTFNGWTMQRGTDIGPLIPHIGPPSLLTPLDMLFSSSASYFGPSSHTVEGQPVAAALFMFANPNLNCNWVAPLPTGLVLCFTTHYVGMSIFDILFGAVAMDVATGAVAGAASGAVQRSVIKPISKRVSAKLASRKAAKAATPGTLTPAATAPAPAKATPGGWQSAKPSQAAKPTPGGPPPGTNPQVGGHRPTVTPPTVKPPRKRLTKKQFAVDMGLDVFGELTLGLPFTMVNEMTFELLAMTGVEEFGAKQDDSQDEAPSKEI